MRDSKLGNDDDDDDDDDDDVTVMMQVLMTSMWIASTTDRVIRAPTHYRSCIL